MENQANLNTPEPATDETEKKSKKEKKNKNEKFKWWQSLLILVLTLAISIGAAYYISDKYFWSKLDIDRVNEQLDFYKDKVDGEPNEPRHRINLGYTYFLKGDNDEAIKQLKIALDLDKNNYDAHLNLAIVYTDEESLDTALKSAQKATEIAPRDYKGQLQKGIIFRKLKMYEDSLEALNQANTLMPGNTTIITEIAHLFEDQGLTKEAEDVYKEALSFDPLYKDALDGLDRIAANDTTKD